MSDNTEKYSISITVERHGDTWTAQEQITSGGTWCFAMAVTRVLGTLREQVSLKEWREFVAGIIGTVDEEEEYLVIEHTADGVHWYCEGAVRHRDGEQHRQASGLKRVSNSDLDEARRLEPGTYTVIHVGG